MKFQVSTIMLGFLACTTAMALDQEACNAAAKQIDDRLAQGGHPQQNVALATQMRDGILQSCAFLDEATLAGMSQGLDQLLPGGDGAPVTRQKSQAERDAERDAQRAESQLRRAARDERRAAAQEREAAEQGLISEVAIKPPTGQSVKGQLLDRADSMWGAAIVDWDLYNDNARLLYLTHPSRDQSGNEDAAQHYYVVEFSGNDSIVQHHIVATKPATTTTAGLLRGRDEVILQRYEHRPNGGETGVATLERWSIADAELLSSAPAPQITGPRGTLGPEHVFQLVTDGGELLYVTTVAMESGPTARKGVAWLLASPDGEVRDQQIIAHADESISTRDWFRSAAGGAGLLLDVSTVEETGIASSLKPEMQQFGNTAVQPVVGSERRIYIAGESATGAELPAFERRLMWMGMENVDQSVMISGESTRLMQEAEGKYRVQDSDVTLTVAGRNRTVVQNNGVGHAVLLKNNLRDDEFPPTRGLWLQEFVSGKERRDTYLEPDARHLKALFNMLASDINGNLYVASDSAVLRLNPARQLIARAESRANEATVKAIVAGNDMLWLFGEHAGGSTGQQKIWVERMQF